MRDAGPASQASRSARAYYKHLVIQENMVWTCTKGCHEVGIIPLAGLTRSNASAGKNAATLKVAFTMLISTSTCLPQPQCVYSLTQVSVALPPSHEVCSLLESGLGELVF